MTTDEIRTIAVEIRDRGGGDPGVQAEVRRDQTRLRARGGGGLHRQGATGGGSTLKAQRCALEDEMPRSINNKCKECRVRYPNRSRGLCSACYQKPEVRMRYVVAAYCEQGLGLFMAGDEGRLKDCRPTTALPGTLRKLAVLRGRARRREKLHHPLDARHDVA